MDPRAFLIIANRLLDAEQNPQGFRTAISRAYYAAFHVAPELLERVGCGVAKGPQGHGQAQHRLNNSGDQRLADIAGQLGDLHGERIRSDYRLDNVTMENPKGARDWVSLAGDIIAELGACRRSRERLRDAEDAIKAYLRILPS